MIEKLYIIFENCELKEGRPFLFSCGLLFLFLYWTETKNLIPKWKYKPSSRGKSTFFQDIT